DQPYREFHARSIRPGGLTTASVYRTRHPPRSIRRRPRGPAIAARWAPSLQAMEGKDAPANRLDLAVDVVLGALPALIGKRLRRIPERLRAELVAARVRAKRRGQRVGQRDAVQHGPRGRPPARHVLHIVAPAAEADELRRQLRDPRDGAREAL